MHGVQYSSPLPACDDVQDPETGLPEYRRSKLVDVFKVMDKVQTRACCSLAAL